MSWIRQEFNKSDVQACRFEIFFDIAINIDYFFRITLRVGHRGVVLTFERGADLLITSLVRNQQLAEFPCIAQTTINRVTTPGRISETVRKILAIRPAI